LFFAFLLSLFFAFLLSFSSSRIYYFDQKQPDLSKERWGIRHGNDGNDVEILFFACGVKKTNGQNFFLFLFLELKKNLTILGPFLYSPRPQQAGVTEVSFPFSLFLSASRAQKKKKSTLRFREGILRFVFLNVKIRRRQETKR